jgi:hypothetical protein
LGIVEDAEAFEMILNDVDAVLAVEDKHGHTHRFPTREGQTERDAPGDSGSEGRLPDTGWPDQKGNGARGDHPFDNVLDARSIDRENGRDGIDIDGLGFFGFIIGHLGEVVDHLQSLVDSTICSIWASL